MKYDDSSPLLNINMHGHLVKQRIGSWDGDCVLWADIDTTWITDRVVFRLTLNGNPEVGDVLRLGGRNYLVIDKSFMSLTWKIMLDTPEANRLLIWKLAYEVEKRLMANALWLTHHALRSPMTESIYGYS